MNIDEPLGKKYMDILEKLGIGEALEMGSMAPGLSSTPSYAVLTAVEPAKARWSFNLYWYDIPIGKATVQREGQTLVFKEKM
jgi:hypothetical protein